MIGSALFSSVFRSALIDLAQMPESPISIYACTEEPSDLLP